MKDQINVIIKVKKFEALTIGLLSLVLFIGGIFTSLALRDMLVVEDFPMNGLQRTLAIYSYPISGLLGFGFAGWHWFLARKIENSN